MSPFFERLSYTPPFFPFFLSWNIFRSSPLQQKARECLMGLRFTFLNSLPPFEFSFFLFRFFSPPLRQAHCPIGFVSRPFSFGPVLPSLPFWSAWTSYLSGEAAYPKRARRVLPCFFFAFFNTFPSLYPFRPSQIPGTGSFS